MANDFDELTCGAAGDGNRLAELFEQVTASLSAVAEKARRLQEVFPAVAAPGGAWRSDGPASPRPGLDRSPGDGAGRSAPGGQVVPDGASPADGNDRVAADNARANQQAARALEELLRNGIKLRDAPLAVYSE